MTAVQTYATENRDAFPYFANPELDPPFTNGGASVGYFAQQSLWLRVVKGYLDHDRMAAASLCPSSPLATEVLRTGGRESYLNQYAADYVAPASYWLSATVFADPRYFSGDPGDPQASRRLLRRTLTHEVLHPSAKGILLEPRAFHVAPVGMGQAPPDSISIFSDVVGVTPYVCAFADGHVQAIKRPDFLDGVPTPAEPSPIPVIHTRDGLRGRDR